MYDDADVDAPRRTPLAHAALTTQATLLESLRQRRLVLITSLHSQVAADQWHSVQDHASELREVDAALRVLYAV